MSGALSILHKVKIRVFDVHVLAVNEKSPGEAFQKFFFCHVSKANMCDDLCRLETMGNLLKDWYVAHGKSVLSHGDVKSGCAVCLPNELSETVKACVIQCVNSVAVEVALIP